MHCAFIADLERRFTAFADRQGITLLRVSLGIVYLWFGALKYFEALSPAEALAGRTIHALSLGAISASAALPILATCEILMGALLVLGALPRLTTVAVLAHLSGTVTPLFFYPDELFTHVPYAPTMVGQYIIKNLVLASAVVVVGAAARKRFAAAPADAPVSEDERHPTSSVHALPAHLVRVMESL